MYRRHFVSFLFLALAIIAVWLVFWPPASYLLIVWLAMALLGIYDLRSRHNVLNNYPIIGHLRYMLEFVRPELRQYFFESEQSGRPFSRAQRTLINARADGKADTSPFGTLRDFEAAGFDFSEHSLVPKDVAEDVTRITVGGPQCERPYHASRLNISAMSFGSLSGTAVLAMNLGAKRGGFAHNTGEGAISPYHQRHGGDLIWELGTAYFGCRTREGRFDAEVFREKAREDQVKMIELKLSQGAKPSHGGLLPGEKVNQEIAETRQIEQGQDCQSPAAHPEFDTPIGLLEFIVRLRELSGGKPVGMKMCLGKRSEFLSLCKAMRETGIRPDFITIDGAEGGTGAAPQEFSDRLGNYINEALPFVHQCLVGTGLRDDLKLIASGKVALGFDMVVKMALGADMCNAARPFMFSVGCIQARRCHTNQCPTGVTTQDPKRSRAINVEEKAWRVANYHAGTLKAFRDLTGAMGVDHPDKLTPDMIYHRNDYTPAVSYQQHLVPLRPGQLLEDGEIPEAYAPHWEAARADRF
ncbi:MULTISPECIES: FMN-binding glutamate synthase family protein [unclassified Modicisalibacter]|uniref:FMN-binding glutamate synthase family protein n=1 Tax=unclassified Modicisalibacter TaxID=2679913 RepID=UPI001CC92BB9|nr:MULTISPECIES: FMN-binding glutamate synthase family protein [unclassified Modicisalibacter]MBZ9556859.1 FMN-binding glutamate synthase family protein [Modicisalibacter sp. R2A 31.J]MBZ9574667.1 FMN-binding glutamate synthase family protein [Modicisalibacter sp. MOD 31.J]